MTQNEMKVVEALASIFKSKQRETPHLGADTVLDGSLGLESLDLAELVVRLEQTTGKDPFSANSFPTIRTISDLAALYN